MLEIIDNVTPKPPEEDTNLLIAVPSRVYTKLRIDDLDRWGLGVMQDDDTILIRSLDAAREFRSDICRAVSKLEALGCQ